MPPRGRRSGCTAEPGRSGPSPTRTCWCRSRRTSCGPRSSPSSSTNPRRTPRRFPGVTTIASSGSGSRPATSKRRRGRTAWACLSISPWRRTWWIVTAPRDAEARAASRRLLATSERELQRIVLDMHDGPVQDIFAALSQLQVLDRSLAGDPTAQQRAGQAVRLLERALGEIRNFIGVFRPPGFERRALGEIDRKSTRLNSSHGYISYAVFCLKKKKKKNHN